MRTHRILTAAALLAALAPPGVSAAEGAQHGGTSGHLVGAGAFGALELVSVLRVVPNDPASDNVVADVAVDPRGHVAYLARFGTGGCDAATEKGGKPAADTGTWIIDIGDLDAPSVIGFIAHSQDSRPGEGLQVVQLTTSAFDGYLLVANNEDCGKNGKGGVSLYDVTNPAKPQRLSEHFGDRNRNDTHPTHSAFAWDVGDRAFVAMVDVTESADVDILEITNPRRPRLVADFSVTSLTGGSVGQPALGLTQLAAHDMVVKQIDADSDGTQDWVMLLAYGDGGFVLLNVNDPADPIYIDDTDYSPVDPHLLQSLGVALAPEGNAHQAEFTADNRFFIGCDEDLAPFRGSTGSQTFDGWGYAHLYDSYTRAELDTYAIPEAHDPAFAVGFGDLSVHEVATDPLNPTRAYLASYSGGVRVLDIMCAGSDSSSCSLVEVGGYLDPLGNDFWGVETFVRDGSTMLLASDRDTGLWIFYAPTS